MCAAGSGTEPPASGRLARLRARAERASSQYQRRSQTQPLLGLPVTFVARYTVRQGVLLASALAFRLFLWLMPLALLFAGILAALAQDHAGSLETAAKEAGVAGAASHQAVAALQSGHKSWLAAVLIGGFLLLWTTRTLMRNLALVSAHAWQTPNHRPRQKELLVTTLVFAGSAVALLAVAALITRLDRLFPGELLLAIIVESVAAAAVWLVVSLRLPDDRADWTDLLPGCLLVGVGLAVLHAVSAVYLPAKLAKSSALYGTLGIAGVILAWLLLVGQVIICGALVNSVWAEYRASRRRPDEHV
ncbi:MAG TPA: YhjD/YihY/BrkB family envelope integrity protein [Streptosporangiaceae bacterium]